MREMLLGCDEEQLEFLNDCQLYQMKGMDAYIASSGNENTAISAMCLPKNSIFTTK